MIWELDGDVPQISPDAWIAPDAQIIGKVTIEAGASIWFGAVLRGDNEPIHIGAGSNVQDNCVIHTDPGCPVIVGKNCTVGHKALLHGCVIHDGVLVGMGSTILNRTVVRDGALIGACALVAEDKDIPEGALVLGTPGRVLRRLSDEEREGHLILAGRYRENAERFRNGLRKIG